MLQQASQEAFESRDSIELNSDTVAFKRDPRVLALLSLLPAVMAVSLVLLEPRQMWIPVLAMLAASIAVFLPLHYSLFAYFAFLTIEGALKINSNYNPLAQLGGDVLIAVLLLRAFFDKRTGGVAKVMRTPFIKLILMFVVWLLLQYVNPVGLGILPSIAGTKIYVSMIFLFFLCYHYLDEKQINQLFLCIMALTTIHATLASIEYIYGQEFVLGLHPRYKSTAGIRFIGNLYRPFGLTALPGGPSIWIFLTSPIAMYTLIKPKSDWKSIAMAVAFFGAAIPALIFCQVRSAMVIFALGPILVVGFPGVGFTKRLSRILLVFAAGTFFLWPYIKPVFMQDDNGGIDTVAVVEAVLTESKSRNVKLSASQVVKLTDRLSSLGRIQTFTQARQGAWEAMTELAQTTVFGIGLSRVGAASAPWSEIIRRDTLFGPKWSFADNLYRAIFTEIGLPGLAAWLIMVLSMVVFMFSRSFNRNLPINHFLVWSCAVSLIILILAGWGSEGILYTPVSSFFWLYIAAGLKGANDVAAS